jgi:hypothetical protein
MESSLPGTTACMCPSCGMRQAFVIHKEMKYKKMRLQVFVIEWWREADCTRSAHKRARDNLLVSIRWAPTTGIRTAYCDSISGTICGTGCHDKGY